jgi:hypothetical protein
MIVSCQSRVGGNPMQKCANLHEIPAYAGMTKYNNLNSPNKIL